MTQHEVKASHVGTRVDVIYPTGERLACEVVWWWGRKMLRVVGEVKYMHVREDLKYERPTETL